MKPDDALALLSQIIRVGFVCARDDALMRVRVECRDNFGESFETDWLQVLAPRAGRDKQYDLPDVDEEVVCLFLPYGREAGFVLGSAYGHITPPVTSGDKWHRRFADGTWLEYDRASHKLRASVRGDIEADADGDIAAVAGGNIEAMASADIEAIAGGDMHATAAGQATLSAGVSISLAAPVISLAGLLTSTGAGGAAGTARFKGNIILDGNMEITGNSSIGGSSSVAGDSYAGSRSGGCPGSCY